MKIPLSVCHVVGETNFCLFFCYSKVMKEVYILINKNIDNIIEITRGNDQRFENYYCMRQYILCFLLRIDGLKHR